MRTACLVVFCTSALVGCNSSTPTSPTPPPALPVVTPSLPPASAIIGISLIGDMWIPTTSPGVKHTPRLITSNTPFDWVDGSDGVTWSIEPAGVATVDTHGNVKPVAIGVATVKAVYGDKTGTNSIRVLPDYAGTWNGEFIVTGCTGGADPRECGRIMFAEDGGLRPTRYPFSLELSQFRDQISGTLRELRDATTRQSDIAAAVTGFVRLNGALVLEAMVPQPNQEPFRVINWSSLANAASTMMSGAFTQYEPRSTLMTPPYRYVVRTENEFANASRAR